MKKKSGKTLMQKWKNKIGGKLSALDKKKLVLTNIPYALAAFYADRAFFLYRNSPGEDMGNKLLYAMEHADRIFAGFVLSNNWKDLLAGIVVAVVLKVLVWQKQADAKKLRKGIEYGSARWGTAEDIKPYMSEDPWMNIPLTATEALTMESRPKQPKYARNKNIVVIGGSGSGKTRFFVKPSVMQMNCSMVITDPKGTGYRAKSRFARFYNIPELMNMFKEIADIKTSDQLKLPVPEAEYETVVLKPTEQQKEIVESLGERAEVVRNGGVDASVDNMLKITNDGRKLALDQRLVNELLPDNPESKISVCAEKSYEIWKDTAAQKSAQLIFCDLSTPKGDGSFNVYDNLKQKLMEKGVPEKEIAFIHDANTEAKKTELFGKVKSGQVRFLIGSTAKMGAGTNVQDRLIALHHLDIGWKPSDLEQREGRIIRQGNHNKKVHIFRYVTESTFDSYMWQLIENKQKFISQIMTSKAPVRSCEDVDEAALSYAEVKALATGNPAVKEKMALDVDVAKLKLLKANHMNNQYRLEDDIARNFPQQIAKLTEIIDSYKADIAHYSEHKSTDPEQFTMEISGKVFTEKKEAGAALLAVCKDIKAVDAAMDIGNYQGFNMRIQFDGWSKEFILSVKHEAVSKVHLGADALGNITRINNLLDSYPEKLSEAQQRLETVYEQLANAKEEVGKPFPKEEELNQKLERLSELNALLNMDEREDAEAEVSESDEKEERSARGSIHEKLQIYKEKSQRESETGKENRKRDFGLE